MSESGPLSNIGELAKPATVLIEKISDAVGAVFEPYQIRRIARAKADAAVIDANAQIEVTELHRRAMVRFVHEEGKKQENIESITSKAIPDLNENSRPDAVSDDWIANFFDKCRLISDAEMQQLWGKVLAGEANSPGTYSKRTVAMLESLDKQDALEFTKLCSCTWTVGEVVPLIFDVQESVYASRGITFSLLTHLDAIGLIRFESMTGFQMKELSKRTLIHYYGTAVLLEFKNETGNSLNIGHAMFTQTGRQLAPICGAERNDAFYRFVLDQWAKKGISVSSPVQSREVTCDSTDANAVVTWPE